MKNHGVKSPIKTTESRDLQKLRSQDLYKNHGVTSSTKTRSYEDKNQSGFLSAEQTYILEGPFTAREKHGYKKFRIVYFHPLLRHSLNVHHCFQGLSLSLST
jgi:hypothetical protein